MGFFACYCGFIYNDFFSLSTNFFGSCFENQEHGLTEAIEGCVYPFGLDPKWYIASNELTFFNSLKMKLAVIIGVTQVNSK
jgi:V-type H+-transporting ATPase subunit a